MSIIYSILKATLGILLGLLLVIILYPSAFPIQKPTPSLSHFSVKKIMDMHLHVAGLGYGNSGCFIGKELSSSYKKYIYLMAFGVTEKELKEKGDQILIEKVSSMVSQSRFTDSAIILAMDGYFEKDGSMNHEKTQVYIPNDYIRSEVIKYPNLLYGASIHPYRENALELLVEAKKSGAALIKWIPSIMNIDPSDQSLVPFYEKMKELGLPLLTHAGQESAFGYANDSFGDPLKLTLPLDIGVQVIAAHVATTGKIDGEEMIDRLLPLFNKYSNLFVDISSLTQANKLTYLDKGLLNSRIYDRALHGSDWPLQLFPLVSPWYFPHKLSFWDMHYINSEKNPLDRDILLKFALGLPESVFSNTSKLLYKMRKAELSGHQLQDN